MTCDRAGGVKAVAGGILEEFWESPRRSRAVLGESPGSGSVSARRRGRLRRRPLVGSIPLPFLGEWGQKGSSVIPSPSRGATGYGAVCGEVALSQER